MSVGRSSLILLLVSTLYWSPLIDRKDGFIAVRIEVKHRLAFTASPLRCKGNAPPSHARPGSRCWREISTPDRVVFLLQALLDVRAGALCRQCKGEAKSDGKINDV